MKIDEEHISEEQLMECSSMVLWKEKQLFRQVVKWMVDHIICIMYIEKEHIHIHVQNFFVCLLSIIKIYMNTDGDGYLELAYHDSTNSSFFN